MDRLKFTAIKDAPMVRILGRTTDERNPLTLFWTGSGLEFGIRAGELWVEFLSDYSLYEPWISIQINGAFISRQMLVKGKNKICIFCGMNPEKIKQVRIIKETQAMSGDEDCLLQFLGFSTDGELLQPTEKTMKIEWIGDSITSGEGAIGAVEEEDWIPMFFSALNNYAVITSDALDAEYRIISQSGWGVLSGWDNNPHCAIPDYYEQVCGLLAGKRNEMLGAKQVYDFSTWQPDFVVVNLGTNDGVAFHQPGWREEATGKIYKQRITETGELEPEDVKRFIKKAVEFLKTIRKFNPKASIIWAYGMIGSDMLHPIYEAIEQYQTDTSDFKIHLLILPEVSKETVGARNHPGELCHKEAAEVLIQYIQSLMKRQQESLENV